MTLTEFSSSILCIPSSCKGVIYTTARARPTLSMAQAGCRLVRLHLPSGPEFNQKFHTIITANASSVCYTFRRRLCVPDSRWCTNDADNIQWNVSHAQPYSRAELSAARFCLWIASRNTLSCTQPDISLEVFVSVDGPLYFPQFPSDTK